MQRSAPVLRSGLLAALLAVATTGVAQESSVHLEDLRAHGREPIAFVLDQLERYDLVVLDDALHTLVEPFEFYGRLVREPGFRERARFVFLEAVPLNQHGHIESYLAAPEEDPGLPDSERIRVVPVGSPAYWSEIRTPRDVEVETAGVRHLEDPTLPPG